MTTYGDSSYYISISTAITGTGNTTGPSGDIIYLWAESYSPSRQNKDKIKQMANNNSYNNRMGKILREVGLTKCVLLDDDGNATTNTDSYSLKINLLDYWCDLSGSAVYLIITSDVDNVNVSLSRSGSSPQYYMKGVITRIRTTPTGNVYLVDLTFKETSLY